MKKIYLKKIKNPLKKIIFLFICFFFKDKNYIKIK